MSEKWNKAQELETQWWLSIKKDISSSAYRKEIKNRALRIENWIKEKMNFHNKLNILEIGGGATQLIDYFTTGNRYAIDPLADLYQKEFADILNPDVKWKKSKIEDIPFNDNFFNIIISRNVLDHVDAAKQALKEIHRVLKKDGIAYIGINTFSGPYYIYKLLVKDPEHPYTFTPNSIKRFITKVNFSIIDSIHDAPENMHHFKDELASGSELRKKIRSLLINMNSFHFSEFLFNKK